MKNQQIGDENFFNSGNITISGREERYELDVQDVRRLFFPGLRARRLLWLGGFSALTSFVAIFANSVTVLHFFGAKAPSAPFQNLALLDVFATHQDIALFGLFFGLSLISFGSILSSRALAQLGPWTLREEMGGIEATLKIASCPWCQGTMRLRSCFLNGGNHPCFVCRRNPYHVVRFDY